jgi:ABC-type transport system involved in cytochrome bd biosynthesis fused ATPase/permease subunit
MRTLVRLVRLLGLPPWRVALSVGLGALAAVAGAVLVGLAGYLICRAAGRPPILSLTTIMVAVRAAALTRPGARYAERLTSHDLAFRALGNVRARMFARIEPLAPAGLAGFRDGELLSRMVADIDQLQDLALRLLLPAAVAVVASTVVVGGVLVVSPVAGVLLGAGLAAAAILGPLVAALVVTRSQRRQSVLRARLTADLVDALDAADELWLNAADGQAAAAVTEHDRELVQVALRDARAAGTADAVGVLAAALTSLAVLTTATAAAGRGALDPLLVAPLTLVAVGAFEAVLPLSVAARQLPGMLAAGRRVLELVDRQPEVRDPARPAPPPVHRPGLALDGVVAGHGPDRPVLDDLSVRLAPGARMVVTGPSGAGKSTLAQLLVRFLERRGGDARIARPPPGRHQGGGAPERPGAACLRLHHPRQPPAGPPRGQ